jgi:hypothetical protein
LRALLFAATLPLVAIAVPVVAQEWTFDVQTLTHGPPWVYANSQPMGPFANKDLCEQARESQRSSLDQDNSSQPHLPANAPTITEIEEHGAHTIERSYKGGPTEALFASECRTVSDFQAQQIWRVPAILRVDDCGKTPEIHCAYSGQRTAWPQQRMRANPRRHALQPNANQPTSDLQRLWYDP